MGLQSLPVAFGVETAKWICVASIDATQVRKALVAIRCSSLPCCHSTHAADTLRFFPALWWARPPTTPSAFDLQLQPSLCFSVLNTMLPSLFLPCSWAWPRTSPLAYILQQDNCPLPLIHCRFPVSSLFAAGRGRLPRLRPGRAHLRRGAAGPDPAAGKR